MIWSGEDSPSDTLKPKLVLAGADLERVHFITGMMDGVDEEGVLTHPKISMH